MTNGSALRLHSRFTQIAQTARWSDLAGAPLGRQPGGATECGDDAYWHDQLVLARDPARGNKISEASLEEAAVALHAKHSGVLDNPAREKTGGSEFVDAAGQSWDVKSPFSPPPQYPDWIFDAQHHVEVVRHEVSGGERVLLNLTRCTPQDAAAVKQQLIDALSDWDEQRVLVLANAT
jgi:hypothetical protein